MPEFSLASRRGIAVLCAAMIRFSLCLALAVAACAAPKPDAKSAQGSGSDSNVVCHEVSDTGSLFSHTECTPVDQSKQATDRDATQRFIKTPRANPSGVH